MNETYTGVGVALATPFTKDLEVDFDGLKNLVEHTAAGVDYFVVHGTTGESVTTTNEEKARILDFIKQHNHKSLPIIAGIGGADTAQVINKIKQTNLDGVKAVLSVSPYYNKPSQEGLYLHYTKIADASPIPIILYNVPGRTSCNISAETTLRLAEHPNITGIKEAACNIQQAAVVARYKPENFSMISGDDMFTLSLIAMGGVGVISVLANAIPGIFRKLVHSALDGNYQEAREAMYKITDIHPLMYVEGSPAGIKQALEIKQICKNYVRLPLAPASKGLKDKIAEQMNRLQKVAHMG